MIFNCENSDSKSSKVKFEVELNRVGAAANLNEIQIENIENVVLKYSHECGTSIGENPAFDDDDDEQFAERLFECICNKLDGKPAKLIAAEVY